MPLRAAQATLACLIVHVVAFIASSQVREGLASEALAGYYGAVPLVGRCIIAGLLFMSVVGLLAWSYEEHPVAAAVSQALMSAATVLGLAVLVGGVPMTPMILAATGAVGITSAYLGWVIQAAPEQAA